MPAEALDLRRPYFTNVSLKENPVFCIDDRFSELQPYIKVPGGLLFLVSCLAIMRCLNGQPAIDKLEDIETITEGLKDAGYRFGIHSDDSSPSLRSMEGPVGCGYNEQGRRILWLPVEKRLEIVGKAELLRPELFIPETQGNVGKILGAHEKLAADDNLYSMSPRETAQAAVNLGAPHMDVQGQHAPEAIGIINLVPGTTLDTAAAAKNGCPAYDYDAWAFNEVAENILPLAKYDYVLKDQAATIDAIATLTLLGVKEIYVNR